MKKLKTNLKNNYNSNLILFCLFLSVSVSYPGIAELSEYNESVYNAQVKLKELHYDVGESDGLFGVKTKRAVCKFQKDNNLLATCKFDGLTINMLNELHIKNKYLHKEIHLADKIKRIKNKTISIIHSNKNELKIIIKAEKCNFIYRSVGILKKRIGSIDDIFRQYIVLSFYYGSRRPDYKIIAFYIALFSPLAVAFFFLDKEIGTPIFMKIFIVYFTSCCLFYLYVRLLFYLGSNEPYHIFLMLLFGILFLIMWFIRYAKLYVTKLIPYIVGLIIYVVIYVLTILFSVKAYESIGQVYDKISSMDYFLIYKYYNELMINTNIIILFSIILFILDLLYVITTKKRNSTKGVVMNVFIIYLVIWLIKKDISLFSSVFAIVIGDIYLVIYFLYWNKLKKNIQYKIRSILRKISFKYKCFSCIEFNLVIAPHFIIVSLFTYIVFYHPWIFSGIPGDKIDLVLFFISTIYFFIFQYVTIATLSYFTIYRSYIHGTDLESLDESIDYFLSP